MVAAQFREMTENIAKTFGCVVDIYITAPVDPVVNHEEATLYASNIARRFAKAKSVMDKLLFLDCLVKIDSRW